MGSISQISIWNQALGFLGARSVASAEENTPEAIQCRRYWDSARRQALRDFPWSFAQRRAWLGRQSLPSGYEAEFSFAYALPNDCLKAHEIRHEGVSPKPFSLASRDEGGEPCLLTNASRALLLYTADVRQSALFDDLFSHALARKLACLVAVPLLKNNSGKVAELEKLYAESLPRAREASASELWKRPSDDSWLAARREVA